MVPLHTERITIAETVPRTCGDGPERRKNVKQHLPCSPHLRGWSPMVSPTPTSAHLFPAPAGMVPGKGQQYFVNKSVPRTCGDGPRRPVQRQLHLFCSPHLRGWSLSRPRIAPKRILFPAPAGMVPTPVISSIATYTVPRTCGDGPSTCPNVMSSPRCSPHLRGWSPRSR